MHENIISQNLILTIQRYCVDNALFVPKDLERKSEDELFSMLKGLRSLCEPIRHDNPDLKLIIEKTNINAIMPKYSTPQDAGIDVCACIPEAGSIFICPGKTITIPTGLKIGIPEGWFLDIRPRSGISLYTPIRIANSPGTIDTYYKGEIMIIMSNTSSSNIDGHIYDISDKHGNQGIYEIRHGDRIAQIVPQKRYFAELVEGKADSIGEDRGGGLGSTGV